MAERVGEGEPWVGSLSLDLLLGDVHSLKEKRSVVRPVVAELRRRFDVSAAEAGHQDLHRRALLGVAVIAGDPAHCREVLDACERLVADRPELELLSAHREVRRHGEWEGPGVVDGARARQLAVRIRAIAAATLEHQVKDPRLGLVTVTDARVTPDLREATVFYTVYGDDEARELSAAALRSATGVVRSAVGRQTGIKFTPTLTFVADVVPDNARLMEDLLAAARVQDELVAQAREGKVPVAGDDPYRHPRVDDDADGDVDRSGGDEDRRAVVDAGEQSGPA